ncbi:hypothetical protein LDO26_14535 [Luteimonas sp. BDR2-5]|uniref:hypothetical protein n=1 Tax=Proluteimonas luteida TaxID=2878685 RepID=UPI001E474E6C|nr:hypothetical protein [Luteimonas sp. BDR2-5]MCD9029409.1 hypothetical protein [Luteimonas sp. BDR2-5]
MLETIRERGRMLGENLSDAGASMAAGARSALAAVNEWAAERERDMASEAGSGSTMAAVRYAEGDRAHAAQRRAAADDQAQAVVDRYEDGSPGYHAMGIARSAPMMAAAVATRSPSLGALAIGAGTAAEQRSQALADGATPDQATASGLAHGTLEGTMDAVTLGIARWGFAPVKAILAKRFGESVATRMLQQASATAPRRLALAAAEGAASEVPTTLGQMASDELILGTDYTGEDYARGIRDSVVQGAAMSGGVYAVTAPLRRSGSPRADGPAAATRPEGGGGPGIDQSVQDAGAGTGVPGMPGTGDAAGAPPVARGARPASGVPVSELSPDVATQADAMRAQAAELATSGTLGRAAGDVLNIRAGELEAQHAHIRGV